jgi:hypothetical protein
MVHVPRSSESIPLLVPSDAHARDDARARRCSFAESPGAKSHTLVGTALLCFLGLIMYAAASNLAAEERRDVAATMKEVRIAQNRFLADDVLAANSDSVRAELRALSFDSKHASGDLGAVVLENPDAGGPPTAEEREAADEWVEAQNLAAEARESDTKMTIVAAAMQSGLTSEQIEERAQAFDDYQAAKAAKDAAEEADPSTAPEAAPGPDAAAEEADEAYDEVSYDAAAEEADEAYDEVSYDAADVVGYEPAAAPAAEPDVLPETAEGPEAAEEAEGPEAAEVIPEEEAAAEGPAASSR